MTEEKLIDWLQDDQFRVDALNIASEMDLKDWCLAAGFVRNIAWDKMHGYGVPTALNDIDLIYFDPSDTSVEKDIEIERHLRSRSEHPWSVKNQARMHYRNIDDAYTSTEDAMSYWVELETAVGARIGKVARNIEIVAPFGLASLFNNTITMNPKRRKPNAFSARIADKKWCEIWPSLEVVF